MASGRGLHSLGPEPRTRILEQVSRDKWLFPCRVGSNEEALVKEINCFSGLAPLVPAGVGREKGMNREDLVTAPFQPRDLVGPGSRGEAQACLCSRSSGTAALICFATWGGPSVPTVLIATRRTGHIPLLPVPRGPWPGMAGNLPGGRVQGQDEKAHPRCHDGPHPSRGFSHRFSQHRPAHLKAHTSWGSVQPLQKYPGPEVLSIDIVEKPRYQTNPALFSLDTELNCALPLAYRLSMSKMALEDCLKWPP